MSNRVTRSIERELVVDATPQEVWKALTDAEELARWFPLEARTEPGPGGFLTLRWGEAFEGTCRIQVWDPPSHLRTSWMEPAAVPGASPSDQEQIAVDWFVHGKGGRTVLRLVHSGFSRSERWDAEYDGTGRGWTYELRSLQQYLEIHKGKRRRAFWLTRRVGLPPAEVWARLTSPEGILASGDTGRGPGSAYAITTASGDRLEGTVVISEAPVEFAGTVANLGHSLFRTGYEPFAGAHVFLSTWGVPEEMVAGIEKRWRDLLAKLFAPAAAQRRE